MDERSAANKHTFVRKPLPRHGRLRKQNGTMEINSKFKNSYAAEMLAKSKTLFGGNSKEKSPGAILWSGTEIVILSARLQYLVTRRRG